MRVRTVAMRLLCLVSCLGLGLAKAEEAVNFAEVGAACRAVAEARAEGLDLSPDEDLKKVARLCALTTSSWADWKAAWNEGLPSPAAVRLAEKAIEDKRDGLEATIASSVPETAEAGINSTGLSQATIVWALTETIVKRAEEELNIWFFDSFREQVCGASADQQTRIPLRTLVPASCEVLQSSPFLGDVPGGVTTLQAAFRRDLARLPVTLPSALDELLDKDSREKLLRAAEAELKRVKAETPSDDGKKKEHASRVARLGADIKRLEKQIEQIETLESANGLASLRDALRALTFLGRVALARTEGDSLIASILACPDGEGLKPTSRQVHPVSSALYDLSAFLRTAYDPSTDSLLKQPSATQLVDAFRALAVNLKARGAGTEVWPLDPFEDRGPFGQRTFQAASLASRTFEELRTTIEGLKEALRPSGGAKPDPEAVVRAYAAAVQKLTKTTRTWVAALCPHDGDCQKTRRVLERVDTVSGAVATADYAQVAICVLSLVRDFQVQVTLPEEAARLLSFGVELAQAKNADSAATAMKNLIAPAGAYKRKREGLDHYAFVNAYAGLFLAHETAAGEGSLSYGPWVPVGVELGLGRIGHDRTLFRSVGLFVQAIDVGALAAFRVKNGPVETAPETGWNQILSPGLFVTAGLRGAPVSLAIGASYTSKLREVEKGGGLVEKANAIRIGLTFALDLPLFP